MARGSRNSDQVKCPKCGAKTDVGRCRICGLLIQDPSEHPSTPVLLEVTRPREDHYGILHDGERAVASVVGGAPAGTDSAQVPAGGRAMTLTSHRVLLFERGTLSDELALGDVKRAKLKGSRANRTWRLLEISAQDGRTLAIEGVRHDIQTFASALPTFGS